MRLEGFNAAADLRIVFEVFFVLLAGEGIFEGEEGVVELGACLGAVVDALGELVQGVRPGFLGGGEFGFGLEEFGFGGQGEAGDGVGEGGLGVGRGVGLWLRGVGAIPP